MARLGILNNVQNLIEIRSHLYGQLLDHLERKNNFGAIAVPSHYKAGMNIGIFR